MHKIWEFEIPAHRRQRGTLIGVDIHCSKFLTWPSGSVMPVLDGLGIFSFFLTGDVASTNVPGASPP
jgi:hypothetical protein